MTIIKSEFSLALNQVATERGISVSDVLSSIELAIVAAYKKEYPEKIEEIKAIVNKDTGEAKIFESDKDITPPGFGRIAAQTAKQVILQRIREAEKQAILTDYSAKVDLRLGTYDIQMLLLADDGTAHGISVAVYVFCKAFYGKVCSKLNGALVVRRGEGIIHRK